MSFDQTELAHWYYKPEEWDQFIAKERARLTRQFRQFGYVGSALLLGLLILAGAGGVVFSGGVGRLIGVLLLGLLMGGALTGMAWANIKAERTWLSRLRTLSKEIVITQYVVVFGGSDYRQTQMYKRILPSWRIVRTKKEGGDAPVLWIEVSYAVVGSYGQAFRFLVPSRHEKEAEEVARYLMHRR